MFGIYTKLESPPETLDNIRRLWPKLWAHVSDPARHNVGFRLATFGASGDTDQAKLARQLLDLVDAAAYLTPEMREIEVNEALDDLLSAHYGWNNFHNEVPIARRLAALVGQLGTVPASLTEKYVVRIVDAYLTNGSGVSRGAKPHYLQLMIKFDPDQASIALRSFTDPEHRRQARPATEPRALGGAAGPPRGQTHQPLRAGAAACRPGVQRPPTPTCQRHEDQTPVGTLTLKHSRARLGSSD
jgi:hypothetical protein